MILSLIFSSNLLTVNTAFADSSITAESSSSVSLEDPNKDTYKLDDNYNVNNKSYDELLKEANEIFPPGSLYNNIFKDTSVLSYSDNNLDYFTLS